MNEPYPGHYSFPPNLVTVAAKAEHLFQKLTQSREVREYLESKKKIPGAYATVARRDGFPLLIIGLGRMYLEEVSTCARLSQEKAHRLGGYAAAPHFHRLSRQSRDAEKNLWGGAVFGRDYIVSCSGLPEHLDELYSALLLCWIHDVEPREMRVLLSERENEWITRIDFLGLCMP